MKIRQDIADYLQSFDERYADPRTYAAAMSEYLRNKCRVINEQMVACLDLANAVDEDGIPYNPLAVLATASDQSKVYTPGTDVQCSGGTTRIPPAPVIPFGSDFEWSQRPIPSELTNKLNTYLGTAISAGDTIVDFGETYRQMCYYVNGLTSAVSENIVSAQGGLLKSVNAIQEASGIFSTETSAILATLDAIKDGVVESASDLLSQGKALLGEVTDTAIFQNIVGVMNATAGSALDMVKGIGGMIASSAKQMMESSHDQTSGTFVCNTNIGDYEDVSAVSAYAASEVTVFKTAATAVKTVVGVAAGVIGGLLKIGAKLVKKAVSVVAPYVTNPIFTINDKADRDTLDIPIITYREPLSTFVQNRLLLWTENNYVDGEGNTEAHLFNYMVEVLGEDPMITAPDYWAELALSHWLKTDEAFCLDMKFGQAYCYKYYQEYNGVETEFLALELYAIPTKPITGDAAAYGKIFGFGDIIGATGPSDAPHVTFDVDTTGKTLREKLDYIFPDDPDFIRVEPNDLYKDDNVVNFTNCIRASVYRMLVYWFLRANVYAIGEDDNYQHIMDKKGFFCQFVEGDTGRFVGIHDMGGFIVCPPKGMLPNDDIEYRSPTWGSSGYQPVISAGDQNLYYFTGDFEATSTYDMYNMIKSICTFEQVNLQQGEEVTPDWFIRRACINADVSNTLLAALWPFINMFFSGVLTQILSNKYEYMKVIYDRYENFPVFIPYKTVVNLDTSKYHLQTTAQMMAKAEKLKNLAATIITLIATVAAVIAIKVLVKKGLTKVMEKLSNLAEGNHYAYQGMQQAYQNNTTYNYIPAGKYTKVSKQQLHFIEKYTPMWLNKWNQLFNGQIDSVEASDMPTSNQVSTVNFVPDKDDYKYFTKKYVSSAKMSKLKSNLLGKCGVKPVTYNIYGAGDEVEDTTVTENAASQLIDLTAYDEEFKQVFMRSGKM